jgi:mRNA interferase MazF
LKRGEVWTLSGGPDYASKPRPAVIVHSDAFPNQASATLTRIEILPTPQNGLERISQLMIDKITSVPKSKLGKQIGSLTTDDMAKIDEALLIYLGLVR